MELILKSQLQFQSSLEGLLRRNWHPAMIVLASARGVLFECSAAPTVTKPHGQRDPLLVLRNWQET